MSISDIVLPLHILSLVFAFVNIAIADHQGFDWMRGKVQTLDINKLHRAHKMVSIGLGLMIVTGFTLFWPMREFLLTQTSFFIKMAFVAALLINGFVINRFMKVATERPFASLSMAEKMPLLISGAVSTVGWLGALTTAFFLIPD